MLGVLLSLVWVAADTFYVRNPTLQSQTGSIVSGQWRPTRYANCRTKRNGSGHNSEAVCVPVSTGRSGLIDPHLIQLRVLADRSDVLAHQIG